MEENTAVEMEENEVVETTEAVEKAPRKKKDVSGPMLTYAAENPFNGSVVQKTFRASEVPVGVIFTKLIREKAPPVCLSRVCEDDSIEGPWSCDEKRLTALAKWISSGRQPFYDKDNVVVQKNILCVGEVEAKAKQPRAPKVAKVAKERAPRKPRDEGTVSKPRPTAFKGLLPEDDCESLPLNFESFTEDGGTAVEVRAFSSKRRALDHAKSLGMDETESENAVTKLDGEWVVTQN